MVWKQQPIYWIIEIIFTWNIFAPFLWALHCTGQSVLSPTKRPRVFHATCKSHVASESSYTVQLSLGQQGWKSCKDALEKTENCTKCKMTGQGDQAKHSHWIEYERSGGRTVKQEQMLNFSFDQSVIEWLSWVLKNSQIILPTYIISVTNVGRGACGWGGVQW